MREREGTLQVRNDRCNFRPYGLFGGKPGRNARNIYNPDRNDEELLPGKFTRTFREGDVFRYEMAGAGGWGDPLERDPAMVLRDVRNELVSLTAAHADYGVVFRGKPLAVDEAATTECSAEDNPFNALISLPSFHHNSQGAPIRSIRPKKTPTTEPLSR